jgi:peptide/nickel transport system substrate-binding protein
MKFARPASTVAILAIAGATALAACGKSGTSTPTNTGGGTVGNAQAPAGTYGSVPAPSGTPHAGTVTWAMSPGATPNWILPVVPGANASVYTSFSFQYEMFRPLYWLVNGIAPKEWPELSLADLPKYSNGNKTVTITMKPNYVWSDGKPVTSQDVRFFIEMVKAGIKESPANWFAYTPDIGIPDEIASMSTPSPTTLVMNLKKAYNPNWFTQDQLGGIQPMPAHAWAKASANGPILDFTKPANAKKIYDFLAAQSKSLGTYASNPLWKVVDGPYTLTSFNNTTQAYTMAPNPKYGGPHASKYPTLSAVPFTSDTAEYNALKSGSIDVGYVPLTNLPTVDSIKPNYNVFGAPTFGWSYIAYNFKSKTNNWDKIIGQLYIRQALAHLQDEKGIIKAFFNGAGGEAYGPVPSVPQSPFTPSNAKEAPYPFSVDAAANLLKQHGWTVNPGGVSVCKDAGSGANQCGAGIPAGQKLEFPLIYNTSPATTGQEVTELASQAKKIGFKIDLSSDTFNHMISTYNDPSSPKTIDKWAMQKFGGFTNSTYPTTFGVFNSDGSINLGGYADPQADKLIQASLTSLDPAAVTAEASYLTQQQPGLFQPNPDIIWAWKKTISGVPESFMSLTQYQLQPEQWYFTK